VEYIGRRDGQVKIRGFRVELTEVEDAVRRYPGIADAAVAAFDAPSGGKFIAAYVVSDSKVDTDALHAFIAGTKPSYMVPSVTVQIDSIPLNVNGKVDRRKLPVPEFGSSDVGNGPENAIQKKIFDIIAGLLGTDRFGIDTDLRTVGLTSVT
jgi:acyl-coenzyme A synthetase/AMP-(fatty) acid ligase